MAAVNDAAQTPGANAAFTFENNRMTEGLAIDHSPDTGVFRLTEDGIYQIHYNTVATNAASASLPASVGVHLTNEGAVIPGTTATSTISGANDTAVLSGTTIVNVTSAPATISLVAENGDGSYSHTSLVITKIG